MRVFLVVFVPPCLCGFHTYATVFTTAVLSPRSRRSIMRTSLLCLLLALTVTVPMMAQKSASTGLRLIVVKTEDEAKALRSRVQAGEAFADLAKKYSTDA